MARRKSRRPKPERRPAAPPSAGRAAPTPESPSQALKGVRVPRSGRSGIHWPAIPNYAGAVVLGADTVVVIDCPVDYAENMKLTEKLGALPTRRGRVRFTASGSRVSPERSAGI